MEEDRHMKTTRRSFLKASMTGLAAGNMLNPADLFALGKPVPGGSKADLKSALDALTKAQSDMKIKSVESFTYGNLGFVKVTTNTGAQGFGQMAPYDADITALILHRKVAPHAVGSDPYDIAGIVDNCIDRNLKFPWSYVCRALSGLDTALWDLKGKMENKSVCEMLGGSCQSVAAYGSSMSRKITPEEEAKRVVALRDSFGFKSFKVRIGTEAGHNRDAWPGRTEKIVPTVRKALGDDVGLMVDANSCYTVEKAIEIGKMLQENKVIHFEEPCPYWEFEWAAKVTKALKLSVAGGEQNNDPAQWRRIIAMPAYDIIQPDVCYLGGITRTLRVVAMSHKAKLKCIPHSANLSMVTVFALHLMGAIPNAGDYVEYTIENDPWTRDLFEPALKVRDGKVAIPNGPGWGIIVNKSWLEKASHQITS